MRAPKDLTLLRDVVGMLAGLLGVFGLEGAFRVPVSGVAFVALVLSLEPPKKERRSGQLSLVAGNEGGELSLPK